MSPVSLSIPDAATDSRASERADRAARSGSVGAGLSRPILQTPVTNVPRYVHQLSEIAQAIERNR